MRFDTSKRSLRRNRRGGIEGLPLQLMIVLMIATMGTGIILGWMGSVETPHTIGAVSVESGDIMLESSSGSAHYTSDGFVEIYVADQDGNPLSGATVVLSGLGVCFQDGGTAYARTDAYGFASFEGLNLKLRGSCIGYLTVNVSMPGYGEDSSTRIAVIA
ncbi:MAG: carboxypeptidase-like regulatory domain-containing protein [Candidatus Methanomethylophilaceae archaeon]|jgi:hypothetical protein|nr:carboxypeptidase-like regulatory domain-containing protein [Candidatus Methanomethylophilaceae archaeon]